MKKDIYKIDNTIERILSGKNSLFLDGKEYKNVIGRLKKINYEVYLPYKTSEKVIIYTKEEPKVSLFKIDSYEELRHQDILGSILGLNISPSYLGDIIIDEDNYYFYILSELSDYIIDNLIMIGNKKVKVEELDINYLKDYERKYEEYEVIVSSLRVDNVISRIINVNRKEVLNKIQNKEIILNYDILNKGTYILKEDDIFSIRRYGKYKYIGICNTTKKDNFVIKYLKYK